MLVELNEGDRGEGKVSGSHGCSVFIRSSFAAHLLSCALHHRGSPLSLYVACFPRSLLRPRFLSGTIILSPLSWMTNEMERRGRQQDAPTRRAEKFYACCLAPNRGPTCLTIHTPSFNALSTLSGTAAITQNCKVQGVKPEEPALGRSIVKLRLGSCQLTRPRTAALHSAPLSPRRPPLALV